MVSGGDRTLSQIKNIALTVECHLSNPVRLMHYPEGKSWWTYEFIHIPLIILQDAMSSKDFYKHHRWPLSSSVLQLTVERNWILGKRKVPESIWIIQMLPTPPPVVATHLFAWFSLFICYGDDFVWQCTFMESCLQSGCKYEWMSWGLLTMLAMLTFNGQKHSRLASRVACTVTWVSFSRSGHCSGSAFL